MAAISFELEKLKAALNNAATQKRRFSGLEANIDLIQHSYPSGSIIFKAQDWAQRWSWKEHEVLKIISLGEAKGTYAIEKGVLTIKNADDHFDTYLPSSKIKTAFAQSVIDIYNEVFKRNTIVTDHRTTIIWARLQEGKRYKPKTSLQSFRAVFEFKRKTWGYDEHMKQHLEIETLCAKKHFSKYLEQAREDFIKKQKNEAKPN
jgi:uncharacterized phage protein (TIGR02220 family)